MKDKYDVSCQAIQRMIPDFIADQLNINDLEDFMKHMEKCAECREELTIQFLIQEGLIRSDEEEGFNLQASLDATLEKAYKKIRMHHFFRQFIVAVEILGIIALLVAAVILIR